jgi:uncharacterized protein DUF5994
MTTAPTGHLDAPVERVPLRLRLRSSTSDDGGGAWWPQSRDLGVEVADLVDNFPDPTTRITRLLISRADWVSLEPGDRPVRQVRARHGIVNVGLIARGGARTVVLMLASGERLRLRVIASNADPMVARRLLRDAGGPRSSPTARTGSAAGTAG